MFPAQVKQKVHSWLQMNARSWAPTGAWHFSQVVRISRGKEALP